MAKADSKDGKKHAKKDAKNKKDPAKTKKAKGSSKDKDTRGKAAPTSTKVIKAGKPREDELPSTVARSDEKAQRTFATVHDSAAEQYGEEERAYRTAFSALKHTHEKVGDHWEPKEAYGPSDQHAAEGQNSTAPTAEGVDANASKQHLYQLAQRLEIPGRSRMGKDELVEAIVKANRRAAREARS